MSRQSCISYMVLNCRNGERALMNTIWYFMHFSLFYPLSYCSTISTLIYINAFHELLYSYFSSPVRGIGFLSRYIYIIGAYYHRIKHLDPCAYTEWSNQQKKKQRKNIVNFKKNNNVYLKIILLNTENKLYTFMVSKIKNLIYWN